MGKEKKNIIEPKMPDPEVDYSIQEDFYNNNMAGELQAEMDEALLWGI